MYCGPPKFWVTDRLCSASIVSALSSCFLLPLASCVTPLWLFSMNTNNSVLVPVEYMAKSTLYSITVKTGAMGAVCGAGDSYEPPLTNVFTMQWASGC